jgi:hypothetical protein
MLYEGIVAKLDFAIKERIRRFKAFSEKMPESREKYRSIAKADASEVLLKQKKELHEQWPALEDIFAHGLDDSGDPSFREPFLEALDKRISENATDYITTIQDMDETCSVTGTAWLQGIVDSVNHAMLKVLPAFRSK